MVVRNPFFLLYVTLLLPEDSKRDKKHGKGIFKKSDWNDLLIPLIFSISGDIPSIGTKLPCRQMVSDGPIVVTMKETSGNCH